jgi:uncharacterized protein YggE
MNKKWLVVGAIVAVLLLVLLGCGSQRAFSGGSLEIKGNLNSQQEGISVNGEGKVTAVPDVAVLSVGVQSQALTVADAQSQASGAMDKVMTALKNGGVAAKDIQTRSFNIQKMTKWDSVKQESIVTGYQVNNMVTAKIRDIDKAGTVIDAVTAAGGDLTRIDSISFTIDNPASYQEQARQKAVADAASKAKQLADAAGVKLGKPIYITESSYVPATVYRDAALKSEATSGGTTTPVSAGELEVTANVQISYEIK